MKTTLPVRVATKRTGYPEEVIDANGQFVCEARDLVRAHEIVRSINSNVELRSLLGEALELLDDKSELAIRARFLLARLNKDETCDTSSPSSSLHFLHQPPPLKA